MKKAIYLTVGTILLSGCYAHTTATETIAQGAKESILAIKESIPDTCKTVSIEKQINSVLKNIDGIEKSCEDQKRVIELERDKWKFAFFATLVAIAVGLYIKGRMI